MDMPILMNRVYETPDEAKAAKRGPLDFMSCRRCGFTWNHAFDSSLINYDGDYENDQSWSPAFRKHMRDRAADVVKSFGDTGPIDYLEVGCGQGYFIEEVAETAGSRLRSAFGFDPAWRGAEADGPHGSRIYSRPFEKNAVPLLHGMPNVIVSRHTIEHVRDPIGFLSAIRDALDARSRIKIWIETPCVEWIFDHRAMQDFFYEHCSLFTAQSLEFALERTGFSNARVMHVFGGQYLWAEADVSEPRSLKAPELQQKYASLDAVLPKFVEKWRNEIAEASDAGPVALWGAGAKGVSFSIIVDPDCRIIDHVVDVNPRKQGRYLPGSGLPVLSPEESSRRGPGTIYVMNPNYMDEIALMVRELGLATKLVSID
jgi:SAM-dependent methyltransferase